MTKHHIIYHNDADGYCSAAIAYEKIIKSVGVEFIELHKISYGMPFPEGIDSEKDHIYVLDFCFQPASKMAEIAEKFGSRMVWVDHHQTSVDAEDEYPVLASAPGLRRVNWSEDDPTPVAGCELAWAEFFPLDDIPPVVTMVGDWDTWRWQSFPHEDKQRVRSFQYYLNTSGGDPSDAFVRGRWRGMFECSKKTIIDEFCSNGYIAMVYQEEQWKHMMMERSFEAKINGMNVIVVNARGNSTMFDGFYDPEKHDVMVAFTVRESGVTVSMYTDKTDQFHLGRIAKKIGEDAGRTGGGHAGAAGFQCDIGFFMRILETGDLDQN